MLTDPLATVRLDARIAELRCQQVEAEQAGCDVLAESVRKRIDRLLEQRLTATEAA